MVKDKEVTGRECRFVVHIPANRDRDDIHMVKEVIHYSDGTTEPNVRLIRDFKRPYWITRRDKQVHKDKREWEEIENLVRHEATESALASSVAIAIGQPRARGYLRALTGEYPYIYGTEVNSRVFIKESYTRNFKGQITPYSVATLDIETNTISLDNEDPIIISISFEKETHIYTTRDYVKGIGNVEGFYNQAVRKYLGKEMDERGQQFKLFVEDDIIDCIRKAFMQLHKWKPDWLAIWNMDFDIPKILGVLRKFGVDPADILCDPDIPHNLRVCKYQPGQPTRTKSNGDVVGLANYDRWHVFHLTASFYFIDAMCVFRQIRLHQQQRSSYSLDSVLDDILKVRKLDFKEAEGYINLEWHKFMQANYKVEYMVYAAFDSLSMLMLDEKTRDLSMTLPSNAASTDFENFRSQPRRIADALFFFGYDRGLVLGTSSSGGGNNVYNDNDYEDDGDVDEFMDQTDTLSLRNWILTLPAHLSVLGMSVIEEDPTLKSTIRGFVYDSDAVAAYPTATSVTNQSKSTTSKELVDIEGVPEDIFRAQNLNAVLGAVNSVEYATHMFGMPELTELI